MPRLLWVSPEGTNNYDTLSTLGTGILLRRPMFQQAWKHGWKCDYMSVKKDAHLWDGGVEMPGLRGHDDLRVMIGEAYKKYAKLAKDKNRKIGNSASRWIVSRSIDYVVDHYRWPEVDLVWIEYVDPGLPAVILCMSTLLHYARANVPILLRDPDLKFRYTPTLAPLGVSARSTIYKERIQRYISDRQIEDIWGKFVLCYMFPCEWGSGDFARGYEYFPSAYDRSTDLPVRFDRKKDRVTYIGNVNGREKMALKYYGSVKQWPIRIWGRWPDEVQGRITDANPRITFRGVVPYDRLWDEYARAKATIHITRRDYAILEQMTDRATEVSQAGTLLMCPEEAGGGKWMALPDFNFSTTKQMNQILKRIMEMKAGEYESLVEYQRAHLHSQFSPEILWGLLMGLKDKYYDASGSKPNVGDRNKSSTHKGKRAVATA